LEQRINYAARVAGLLGKILAADQIVKNKVSREGAEPQRAAKAF
jgi:hypothetical protein